MRIITTTNKIYKFLELSRKAKNEVKQFYKEQFGYSWKFETIHTIKELIKRFDGSFTDSYINNDNLNITVKFSMPDMTSSEIDRRLAKLGTFDSVTLRGHGDCVLTGYFMDEEAINAIRIARNIGEIDLNKLIRLAIKAVAVSTKADYKAQFEDENFAKTCEANDWEFLKDGTLLGITES